MDKSHMTIEGKKVGSYLLQKMLGKGQYGVVYKAQDVKTGKEFAVKKIDKHKINSQPVLKRLLKTEVSIMHEINHPNILHLYDFLESSNNYYLVVDYCNQGDFKNYLQNKNKKYLEEEKAVYFLKQIMNGFQILRKHKVLHRDFKLPNLFVNNETLLIGDFGFAKSGQDMAETKLGTPLTMAYEILTANSENLYYTNKADLWSIGVVYYEMLFGKTPFFGFTVPDLIKDIKKKVKNLPFPIDISNESQDLIKRLLKTNPKERIDWSDFFNHPLFYKFNNLNDDDNALLALGDMVMQNKNSNSNQEFQYQQQKAKQYDQVEFMDQDKLLQYGEQNNFHTQNIVEENLNQSEKNKLEKNMAFKEIQFLYNHQKNKIYFLIYTVKKTQKCIKNNLFNPMKEELHRACVLILKKAITLNQCNETHLDQGNNIYELNSFYFNELKKDPFYDEIKKNFKEGKQQLSGYFQLVLDRCQRNGMVFPYMNLINQQNPILSTIDDILDKILHKLKSYMNSSELMMAEKKRKYFLILYSIKLCINSEKLFPYMIDTQKYQKFNWSDFYDQHEKLSVINLINLMQRSI